MRCNRLPLLLALLLAACPEEWEGDEPGECSDLADNDRDGAFDCADEGCAASPECAAGDDDSGAADDDSGDDDSGAADDDDGGDDDVGDDDTGDQEWVDSASPIVAITAPNFGYDLATDLALVTLEGVAREDVIAVSWQSDSGGSGSADGVQAWSIADVPLVPGDNVITVVGSTTGGDEGQDSIVVVSTPGVPLASGLTLSETVAFVGTPVEVAATVWVAGEVDSVVVGTSDPAGSLLDQWGELAPPSAGGPWSGSFVVDEGSEALLDVRAFATAGTETGATPPVAFQVMEAPDEASLSALAQLAVDVDATYQAAGPDVDPIGARDAVIADLLSTPDVEAVGTSDDDGFGAWWIAGGVGFVLMNNPDGTRSGGSQSAARKPMPRTVWPSTGTGAPRGWTASSQGLAGRAPPSSARASVPVTGSAEAMTIAAYLDQFAPWDETPEIETMLALNPCPEFSNPGTAANAAATVATFEASLSRGLVVVSSHGDSFFAGAPIPDRWGWNGPGGQVAVLTRSQATLGNVLAYAGDLLAGRLVISVGSPGVLAYLPAWVTTHAAASPMPNSLVGISACRSAWNDSMASAYLAAGAAYYYGYTDYVNSDYAHDRTLAFWTDMLDRQTTGHAYSIMASPWVPDDAADPAYPLWWGDTGLYLGSGELTNGGFESGVADWISTGQSSFQTNWALPGYGSVTAAEGSAMGWSSIQATASNYHEWEHLLCPVPGSDVTVSFKWQVVTEDWGSCGSGNPNWLNLRVDTDEGNTEHWAATWAEVCPLLADVGPARATGWQDAQVTITAPATVSPGTEGLAFSVGGWNYDGWYGLVDDVRVAE